MKYVDEAGERFVKCLACDCMIHVKNARVIEKNEKDPKQDKHRCLDEAWCGSHGRNEGKVNFTPKPLYQQSSSEAGDADLRRMRENVDAIRAMTFEPGWLEPELVEIRERLSGKAAEALNDQLRQQPVVTKL